MITQTNVSDTYRYAFSSGDDGYMYIDNVNLSTDEVTRLQFSKNGALDLLTINDGDLNYIGHFISDADLVSGYTESITVQANSYTETTLTHNMGVIPNIVVSLRALTGQIDRADALTALIQEVTSNTATVRVFNSGAVQSGVNLYWIALRK